MSPTVLQLHLQFVNVSYQACDRLCHHVNQICKKICAPFTRKLKALQHRQHKSVRKRIQSPSCTLPASTKQPSSLSDMQHSSLVRHLSSHPQSAPRLLSDRKAKFLLGLTGKGRTTRCATEEGVQFPKWPQQRFRRNLPTPQKLCGVKPKASIELSAL